MLMIEKMATRYFAGTASVQAGGTIVTPHGAVWAGNIWGDDLFFLPSQPMVPPQRIEQINEDGTAQLAYPWPGVDAVEADYEIRYVGIIERSTAQSRRVLEQLGDVKSWADVFVATDADRLALETSSNPLRAGYRVLVTEDGLIWAKASGAYGDWLPPAEFKGDQGIPGPYTDITFGPVTTVSPTTPASAVVVPTGPASIRIDLSIPKGLDGTGTGDFVGPNGGVADGDLVAFSSTTGKAGKLAVMPAATVKGRRSGHGDGAVVDVSALYLGIFTPVGFATADLTPAETRAALGNLLGFYRFAGQFGDSIQMPPGFPQTHGVIEGYQNSNNIYGYSWQEFTGHSGNRKWMRRAINASTWGPWQEIYHQGNIVGSVSQSGGVPTGAITSGWISVAGGLYRRHADGTQECLSGNLTIPSVTQAVGTGFITTGGDRPSWTFPVPFSDIPWLLPIFNGTDAATFNIGARSSSVASQLYLFSAISRTGLANNALIYAIGRWYP